MAKNSKSNAPAPAAKRRMSTTEIARIVLGVLLLVNLGAAYMVWNPPGGSAETLEQDLSRLQGQLAQSRAALVDARKRSGSLDEGRGTSDQFLATYFVQERALASTLLEELRRIAQRAGIKDKGATFNKEPIEGSETLGMVTISVNFDGTYSNLLNFVREVDRSDSLLIIESLTAVPVQDSNRLNVSVKINGFIREIGMGLPVQQAATEPVESTAPQTGPGVRNE